MATQADLDQLLLDWYADRLPGASSSIDEICERYPEWASSLRERDEQLRRQLVSMEAWVAGHLQSASSNAAASTASFPTKPPGKGPYSDSPVSPLWSEILDAPTPDSPNANELLGRLGRYPIAKVLGQGGMGAVFLGHDDVLNRPVAIKCMLPRFAQDPSARMRFLREARSLAALRHPNVVTVHEVAESRGIPFLVMELLDGDSAAERLRKSGPFSMDQLLCVIRDAAHGLAAAHAKGFVHRDIKPSNLWIEGEFRNVKILDFGLARDASGDDRLTQVGMVVGTPAYMAPEQVEGKTLDARSDLFSLGSTIYQLATGKLPFQATHSIGILMAILEADPIPVEMLRPELKGPLAQVVGRLLHKTPERRFQSAAELLEALASPPTTPNPPSNTRSWRGGIIVACTILAVAALATFAILPRNEPTNEAGKGSPPDLVPLVAQPKPAGPVDLGKLPTQQWHYLLKQPPEKRLWSTSGLDFGRVDFDAKSETLWVSCDDAALLILGRDAKPPFKMQVHVKQNQWKGGVGLVFGYRETVRDGQTIKQFQTLDLKPFIPWDLKRAFQWDRSNRSAEPLPNGKYQLKSATYGSTSIAHPDPYEQVLEITVAPGRLVSVRFAGLELAGLTDAKVNAQFTEADMIGDVGIWIAMSDAIFRNFLFMPL